MYYISRRRLTIRRAFNLVGDYDLFGHPGDEWRYYLVSGMSANMTSEPTVAGAGPFFSSSGRAIPALTSLPRSTRRWRTRCRDTCWCRASCSGRNLNTNAETFADVLVYKAMSLLDTFPIGDPEVLMAFLEAQYPGAPFVASPTKRRDQSRLRPEHRVVLQCSAAGADPAVEPNRTPVQGRGLGDTI